MDKINEFQLGILYFVDEAIGYRHSLHFYRRWLETEEKSDLEKLIIEVGRENFVNLWPLLHYINNNDDSESNALNALQDSREQGLYVPEGWLPSLTKLTPLLANLFKNETDLNIITGNAWVLRDWMEENRVKFNVDSATVLAMQLQLLLDAKSDFFKLFELIDMMMGPTILSCVLSEDIELFGNMVSAYYPKQTSYIKRLTTAIIDNPTLNWKDALSRNQTKSKMWLLDAMTELKLVSLIRETMWGEKTAIIVVGGWVGLLPFLASMQKVSLDHVINVDIDDTVHNAATTLNIGLHSKFTTSTVNIKEFDFKKYKNRLVIDTIVEHFENHGDWIKTLPEGTTVVLQGNNMFDVPDHVNCHNSLEEFLEDCGLNTILWSGELVLYKCTRFMVIGKV